MRYKWMMMAVAGLAWSGCAQAANVMASDPDTLVKAMQAQGYQAKLGTDSEGDPMIESASSDSEFYVYFYGCEKNRACTNVQFITSYSFDDEEPVSMETINEWNRKKRFASAYVDEDKDACLQMDVGLDKGGISDALFAENLATWTGSMANFEEHIDWEK